MESPLLGLVLDSSAVIGAERNRQTVAAFIEAILLRHGPVDLCLSPVSVAELVHGSTARRHVRPASAAVNTSKS
jgi:predicted nucleic acid-binding protein